MADLLTSGTVKSDRLCVCPENPHPPLRASPTAGLLGKGRKAVLGLLKCLPSPPQVALHRPLGDQTTAGKRDTLRGSLSQESANCVGIFSPDPSGKAAHEILLCQRSLPLLSQEERVLPW